MIGQKNLRCSPSFYPFVVDAEGERERYVADYLKAHPDSGFKDKYADFLRGKKTADLKALYAEIRTHERKVPSLVQPVQERPVLSSAKPFGDLLETRVGDLVVVYLGGISIASFTSQMADYVGHRIDMDEDGLQGRLFLNSDFFRHFDIPKNVESESDMRNVAKAFFKFNGRNYVALVQYLMPDGKSGEHYHSLEEHLVQLAGRSFLELRPVKDDSDKRLVELAPGDKIFIPPDTLHRIYSDEGSLTLPVKQTRRKKDHLYLSRSDKRIRAEIDEFLQGGYNSGTEMAGAVSGYVSELKGRERVLARAYLDEQRKSTKNSNLKVILESI